MTPSIKTIAADIAQELREHPERWQKGANARDARDFSVHPKSPSAVCWCLRGHIIRRLGEWEQRYYADVESAYITVGAIEDSVPVWNDDLSRTVADVIALCERVAGIDPTPCPKCHEAGEHKVGCERGTEP